MLADQFIERHVGADLKTQRRNNFVTTLDKIRAVNGDNPHLKLVEPKSAGKRIVKTADHSPDPKYSTSHGKKTYPARRLTDRLRASLQPDL